MNPYLLQSTCQEKNVLGSKRSVVIQMCSHILTSTENTYYCLLYSLQLESCFMYGGTRSRMGFGVFPALLPTCANQAIQNNTPAYTSMSEVLKRFQQCIAPYLVLARSRGFGSRAILGGSAVLSYLLYFLYKGMFHTMDSLRIRKCVCCAHRHPWFQFDPTNLFTKRIPSMMR
jgi:hypothetical protein